MKKLQGSLSLFGPDIFSKSLPAFSETINEKQKMIKNVLSMFFSHLEITVSGILQSGGLEINSSNYKIESSNGLYLLKRIKIKNNFENLIKKAQINNWLNSQGTMVPLIFKANDQQLVVKHLGDAWCLFQFHDGDYYHEGAELLMSIGAEVGKMHSRLSLLPTDFILPKTIEYFSTTDWNFIQKLSDSSIDFKEIIKDSRAEDFNKNFELLLDGINELLVNRVSLENAHFQTCHLDLHPHNILVKDHSLAAIVDFESFHSMPLGAAIGFSIFKLIRQHLSTVKNKQNYQSDIDKIKNSFIENLKQSVSMEELRLMAKAEVIRRIIYILQANFYRNDTAWNHVLLIQLTGLAEIDTIFSS